MSGGLPPGFILEGEATPSAPPNSNGGLPAGFVLEGAQASPAEQPKGGFGSRSILADIAKTIYGAVTLPGDVYAGKVDPRSDEAIGRAAELAMVASPASAAGPLFPAAKGIPGFRGAGYRPPPAQLPVADDAAQMGIGLTAGQRTADPRLLSRENAMMGGGMGEPAQKIAQDAAKRQSGEIAMARDLIGEHAGRGIVQLEKPTEAGGIVQDALKAASDTAKAGFKSKYDEAFSGAGVMKPEFFTGAQSPAATVGSLSKRITDGLVNRAEPVIVDDILTPAASRALSELDKVSNLQLGRIGQPGAGDVVEGVTLRGVDQARRKLVAFYKAAKQNPTDARAVTGIIKQFDDEIEQAVTNGLFSGDEKFLGTMKEARAAFASYQRTFRPQGAGDDVGRAIQKIVERDATPEEVTNYLIGTSRVGEKGLSVRLADRIKSTLGENSPEWASVRQAAWQRLTDVPEGRLEMGAQKMSGRIADFVNGNGASLAERLFSADERKEMVRFSNILKATIPPSGTANPSNSGNRMMQLARQTMSAIGASVGATAGGFPGAVAGAAAGKTVESVSGGLAAREARKLYGGEMPISIGRKLASGVSSAAPALGRVSNPVLLESIGPRLAGSRPSIAEPEQEKQR